MLISRLFIIMGAKGDLGEELHDDGKNKYPDLSLALKRKHRKRAAG